jgi:hypothetical protein
MSFDPACRLGIRTSLSTYAAKRGDYILTTTNPAFSRGALTDEVAPRRGDHVGKAAAGLGPSDAVSISTEQLDA